MSKEAIFRRFRLRSPQATAGGVYRLGMVAPTGRCPCVKRVFQPGRCKRRIFNAQVCHLWLCRNYVISTRRPWPNSRRSFRDARFPST